MLGLGLKPVGTTTTRHRIFDIFSVNIRNIVLFFLIFRSSLTEPLNFVCYSILCVYLLFFLYSVRSIDFLSLNGPKP